jgi:phosphohistidine phosphatase SixA
MKKLLSVALAFFAAGLLAGKLLDEVLVLAEPVQTVDGDVNGDGDLNVTDPVYLLRFLFLGGPPPAPCPPPGGPASTVVIVRHAEKESTGADPGLTPEGQARAAHLAAVLGKARVDALVASELKRTQETLQPLADLKSMSLELIEDEEDVVARLTALPAGSVAVVAHHSYTIPTILKQLGIEDLTGIDVSGNNYDEFLVVLRPTGGKPQLVHLTY